MDMRPQSGAPQRADARRNREQVLRAAVLVFGRNGTTASTAAVAQEAGVGIGTVFRHFPTKAELLAAALVEHLRQLTRSAQALADAPDAGAAFRSFFREFVERAAVTDALIEALALVGGDFIEAKSSMKGEFRSAVEVLLTRAQAAGEVRADLAPADLLALLVGASRAAQHAAERDGSPATVVQVVLDGL
jgi:AcrR family transcriptional regulator